MIRIAVLSSFIVSNLWASDLVSKAEKSGWIETGRASETAQLCKDFEKKFPAKIKCKSYGKTPEGRDLKYLFVGDPRKPSVWVQAGIHAGEIDGKDAVFWLLRNILNEKEAPGILKKISIVFVPIVNLDGHERFGRWNRPNQVGPVEMGWRTTGQNFNMNRDFAKADAPEMAALLKLWHKIDPVLSLDLHVTNGAQFQPEVGLIVLPNLSFGDSAFHIAGQKFEDAMMIKMKQRNHLALPYYPSFEKDDDPSSGFARYVAAARFAHGYWFNNNRLAMLVETHSWKDYKTRVKTHYSTVLSSLEIAAEYAESWKKTGMELDSTSLSGKALPLEYQRTEKSTAVKFPGYKYTVKKSEISGSNVIKYHTDQPEIWNVPLYEELIPSMMIIAPKEGYFFRVADAEILIPKLKIHNIKFRSFKSKGPASYEVFRASKTQFSPASYEGHQTLIAEGEWKKEMITDLGAHYFIPIDQPNGRLILQLLEPRAKDSFLSWGFFNNYFERKEYMENYVAEEVAESMLKDEKTRKEFESKLKSDPEFASNSELRFEFFYRRHPSWDDRFNRYPVLRR